MRGRGRPLVVLLAVATLVLPACSDGPEVPAARQPSPVATAVPTATPPSSSGELPGAVRAALEEIGRGDAPLTAVAVTRGGAAPVEAHAPGRGPTDPQPVWSVTKSVVSALVGIAASDGLLSLDTPMTELLGDVAAGHPELTVEDLLTMRSGLDLGDSEAGFRQLEGSDDWVAAVLQRPAVAPPGEQFRYCSACVHLLTTALHRATGGLAEWADERLFAPLDLGEVAWDRDPDGVPIGGWGLHLGVGQMARFGQLYLAGGSWEGQQIVPEAWVESSVASHAAAGGPFEAANVGYGYLWWVQEAGHAATGRGGQLIVVVPRADLVVAATAELSDAEAFRAFAFVWSRIVAAFPLAPSPTEP